MYLTRRGNKGGDSGKSQNESEGGATQASKEIKHNWSIEFWRKSDLSQASNRDQRQHIRLKLRRSKEYCINFGEKGGLIDQHDKLSMERSRQR